MNMRKQLLIGTLIFTGIVGKTTSWTKQTNRCIKNHSWTTTGKYWTLA